MSCSILRDDNGKIEAVLAPNGKLSKLYMDALEIVKDKEKALRVWAQGYTPAFKQWLSNLNKTEETKEKVVDNSQHYFMVKSLFESIEELEGKLKYINKTPKWFGSNAELDKALKRVKIPEDMRKQFIQLITENPQLKTIKVSDILSSYLKEFVKDWQLECSYTPLLL
jgi:hypothetical protein